MFVVTEKLLVLNLKVASNKRLPKNKHAADHGSRDHETEVLHIQKKSRVKHILGAVHLFSQKAVNAVFFPSHLFGLRY